MTVYSNISVSVMEMCKESFMNLSSPHIKYTVNMCFRSIPPPCSSKGSWTMASCLSLYKKLLFYKVILLACYDQFLCIFFCFMMWHFLMGKGLAVYATIILLPLADDTTFISTVCGILHSFMCWKYSSLSPGKCESSPPKWESRIAIEGVKGRYATSEGKMLWVWCECYRQYRICFTPAV